MKVSSLSDRWNLHTLPDGPVLCSHDVLSGVGSGVVSEILNMFNIPDTTPDPDIKCSHDGTVRRTVPSCEHHIRLNSTQLNPTASWVELSWFVSCRTVGRHAFGFNLRANANAFIDLARFQYNPLPENDVMATSPLEGAAGDNYKQIGKARPRLHVHVSL